MRLAGSCAVEASSVMHANPQQPGPPTPGGKSPASSPIDVLKPLRRWAAVAWASWLLSIGLLWWQHRTGVLHPPSLLFLGLLALTLGSALVVLVCAVWRALYGPQ